MNTCQVLRTDFSPYKNKKKKKVLGKTILGKLEEVGINKNTQTKLKTKVEDTH